MGSGGSEGITNNKLDEEDGERLVERVCVGVSVRRGGKKGTSTGAAATSLCAVSGPSMSVGASIDQSLCEKTAAGRGASVASFRRFCAVAAKRNSSLAPVLAGASDPSSVSF